MSSAQFGYDPLKPDRQQQQTGPPQLDPNHQQHNFQPQHQFQPQQQLSMDGNAQFGYLPIDPSLESAFSREFGDGGPTGDAYYEPPNSAQSWDQSVGWGAESQFGLNQVSGQWSGEYGGQSAYGWPSAGQQSTSYLHQPSFAHQLARQFRSQPPVTSSLLGQAPPLPPTIVRPPSSLSSFATFQPSQSSNSNSSKTSSSSTAPNLEHSTSASPAAAFSAPTARHHPPLAHQVHHVSQAQLALKKKRAQHPHPPPTLLEGQVVTDKSCARCRIRKVKCDRRYPVCTNCKDRKEECDLILLHPDKKLKQDERDREDARRILSLELELAQVKDKLAQVSMVDSSSTGGEQVTTLTEMTPRPTTIGHSSLDWRLATPQMAASLSQHLCDAFFESCCFLMPTFTYFRSHLPTYADPNGGGLSEAAKAAISAFWVIGARASPHSALLGLPTAEEGGGLGSGSLGAGARRQTACLTLFRQAHQTGLEHRVGDEASEENLAATLALFQMTSFVELNPAKSRGLLRTAIAHFKELQDAAWARGEPEEALELRRTFALAVYSADSITAAYSRRACLTTQQELETYFSEVGIVLPILPRDDLAAVLQQLASDPTQPEESALAMANHLAYCWTCAAQRVFARLSTPFPVKSNDKIEQGIRELWDAIDRTRAALSGAQGRMQAYADEREHEHVHSHEHTHGAEEHHTHENDFYLQSIRVDRDLLDLNAMSLALVKSRAGSSSLSQLLREAEARVRRDLKQNAFYFRVYTHGPDRHMGFHHVFQMEHNPRWTTMALQRVGEEGGPQSVEDELSEEELGWLAEGLEGACFYTPLAEKRLMELRRGDARMSELKEEEA